MEFDKSKVFTAVNADELQAGDKVIVGDTLGELQRCIGVDKPTPIVNIKSIDDADRFNTIYGGYILAYLVERKEYCGNCRFRFTPVCHKSKWSEQEIKLFRCDDYGYETEQKSEKKIGIEKHYRPFHDVDELIGAWKNKMWGGFNKNTMPLIWVQRKGSPKFKLLITEYDMCFQHLTVGNVWKDLDGLFNDYTFLDGSPCGVEE